MMLVNMISFFIISFSCLICVSASEPLVACTSIFSGNCTCENSTYYAETAYIINCTNQGFTNADLLQNLPLQTEVLIFIGNDISQLPSNIFGTHSNYSKLRIIDMSNNNISVIKGKTFHHAPNVERLILNHNSISLSASPHPRVFSNFEKLRELHLTDAFMDNSGDSLASDLHSIFINSNLSRLEKLHLEQNEITKFGDSRIFCDLPHLIHLYLGDNYLTGINFDYKCLPRLQFIDIQGNLISRFSKQDLAALDSYNPPLAIDIRNSKFPCDCTIGNMKIWLNKTKINVRNKNKLSCKTSNNTEIILSSFKAIGCRPNQLQHETANCVFLIISIILILVLICIIIKNSSFKCIRATPIIGTNNIHYTVIERSDSIKEAHV